MSSSTTQHPAKTIAHAFVDLMNGHDPRVLEEFIAEDYIDHNLYVDNGREVQKAFWTTWFAAFPDTEVTMIGEALSYGDRVAGHFSYRATFLGAFMGMPPTGRQVQMHSIDIWRVVDGIAVEHWDTLDFQRFFAQLTEEADIP